jgi:hypothetical protein
MSRFSQIQNAILCLDDANGSHWLEDGRPNPVAVKKIAQIDDLGETEANKFGRVRVRRDVVTQEQIATASQPRPAPTAKAVEDAQAIVLTASAGLDAAREAQGAADRRARTARAALATALQEWQAEFPRMSDEQMRREFIASNQATLAAIKAGTMEAPTGPIPGNSVVDRTATYSAGARRGRVAGQGDAFRRGASTTRGLKLPSAR